MEGGRRERGRGREEMERGYRGTEVEVVGEIVGVIAGEVVGQKK